MLLIEKTSHKVLVLKTKNLKVFFDAAEIKNEPALISSSFFLKSIKKKWNIGKSFNNL